MWLAHVGHALQDSWIVATVKNTFGLGTGDRPQHVVEFAIIAWLAVNETMMRVLLFRSEEHTSELQSPC